MPMIFWSIIDAKVFSRLLRDVRNVRKNNDFVERKAVIKDSVDLLNVNDGGVPANASVEKLDLFCALLPCFVKQSSKRFLKTQAKCLGKRVSYQQYATGIGLVWNPANGAILKAKTVGIEGIVKIAPAVIPVEVWRQAMVIPRISDARECTIFCFSEEIRIKEVESKQ